MTHATKAVMRLLLADNLKLQSWNKPLYTEADLQRCVDKCEVVDYHQTVEYKGIRFTATAAGMAVNTHIRIPSSTYSLR